MGTSKINGNTVFKVILVLSLAILAFTFIDKYFINNYSEKVEITIKSAGDNSSEIEEVLNYYEKDTLKYKAAEYLIENMPYHFTKRYEGEEIINQIFKIISDREKVEKFKGNYNFPETNIIWDSLSSIKPLDPTRYKIIFDQTTITSTILIENIEYAFKAWELPWAKHLTFAEFCEYILPYRFDDEELESWRPVIWEQFHWMIDSLKATNITDPVEACDYINTNIKSWFRFNIIFDRYPKAIKATHLLQAKMGKCKDQAGIATFIMRTFGIPVTHEWVPQWGNRSMGHDFSAVRKKDGTFIDFLGGEHNTGKNYFVDIPPKIYRYTFGVQENHPFFEVNEIIAPKLYNPIYTDVTPEYLDSKKVVVPKSKLYNVKNKLIYLCAFDNNKWVPIDIGKENGENIVFENVGRNIIYLPAQYVENEVFPIGPAILVDDEVSFIHPGESELQTLTLKRKYPINYLKRMWMSWMIGGTFEGSNNERFKCPCIVYYFGYRRNGYPFKRGKVK